MASAFLQIFKSFKLSFIQARYSVWRQPSFKSSNHSSFLLFKTAIQCGVSLSTNIQSFKSFKIFLLFKTAIQYGVSLSINIQSFKSFKISFIQDIYSVCRQPSFKHSNHSNFISFKPASQLFSYSFYEHSNLQIIQNFFYSRQHCRVASAYYFWLKLFNV